ncbi:Pre-mRNA-splicing factor dre4 [Fulvia fulva]|nr:Pre-mRNA-splicing factor dre4 [Fulvia fulva]WPV08864.1 Pre-mRNA-splicing factor dre4 [Fulvia fulva]WPV24888.1 Pre-mRNA-splicing factor dre4 [Fulvia fulva]
MESPNKRQRLSSPTLATQDDFVAFGADDGDFGTNVENAEEATALHAPSGPKVDRERPQRTGHGRPDLDVRSDPRHARDRPKSKHVLPGHEPWILVRTKYRRRFVHDTQTKESLWWIPKGVMPGVVEFETWEKEQKEKNANAKWAEQQLKDMRDNSKATDVNQTADEEGRSRRRRSESLQREDEEAMMAELAAQAERYEEQDVKETVKAIDNLDERKLEAGLESDSEYEVVEVTDDEDEEAGAAGDREDQAESGQALVNHDVAAPSEAVDQQEGPVEFGEDDIAYQLAAMGEEYGLDPGEYGEDYDQEWEDGAEGLALNEEDASNLFRDLLDDYRISPYTPLDRVIADESEGSILNDDRYTVLPNMRARKEVFDAWARDKAAQIKQERAAMEKRDPRIPYLAFLHEKATPKLYWPEFKRKYKKQPEMTDRKLNDKDREKLYRDHINRLKLPESTRKADLQALLKSTPLKALNRDIRLDSLPQNLLSHLHFISLPSNTRDSIVESHIKRLPPAPGDDDMTDEQQAEEGKRREERKRREKAMADRERQVDEERRRAEKDEVRARRNLQDEERELQRAMAVPNRGLKNALA